MQGSNVQGNKHARGVGSKHGALEQQVSKTASNICKGITHMQGQVGCASIMRGRGIESFKEASSMQWQLVSSLFV